MPTYTLRNKETGEVWEDFLTISELEERMDADPNIETVPTSFNLISGHGDVRSKVDDGFKDVLKEVKKSHHGSNIATR